MASIKTASQLAEMMLNLTAWKAKNSRKEAARLCELICVGSWLH